MTERPASASPLRELALVYVGVVAATIVLTLLEDAPGIGEHVHLLVAVVFLLAAVLLARREPGGMRRYGIDLAGLLSPPDEEGEEELPPPGPLGLFDLARALWAALPSALKEIGFALLCAAVVFPPFVLGFVLWHQPAHAFRWTPPPDLGAFALTQVLVVALPEEAFFRGYVQTRLHDRWAPRRFLFSQVHPGVLVIQALLFALVHLVSTPHPSRLAVFFPALLFGWMRGLRGGIGASMLFHAMSNVLADLLVRGYLM